VIDAVPAKVLSAATVSKPLPCCVRVPDPEMPLGATIVSLRLKASVEPAAIDTAPLPSEPVAPPLPTWSVPAEMVVSPT